MKNKQNEIINAPSQEAITALEQMFPKEQGYNKIYLPRIDYVSQDEFEGNGKNAKCVVEAGTFFTNREGDEKKDENGKIQWIKKEIGKNLEATCVYQRRQLKMWDAVAEQWASTPIYDEDTEIVPLFFQGVKIREGTPAELKKMYEFKDEDGKIKTKLKDYKVLYVLFSGELYQTTLGGSSMYSFKTYARKTTLLPAQLTEFMSEARQQGTNKWNCMIFEKKRDLNAEEVEMVLTHVVKIKKAINDEKEYYAKEKKIEENKIVYPSAESEGISGSDIPFD